MQTNLEPYLSARTCLPIRLHATIYYAPSHGLHFQSRWESDLRTLGIPLPLSQKDLSLDRDVLGAEDAVVALWHTWSEDSDLTRLIVRKIQGSTEEMMRSLGVECIVL